MPTPPYALHASRTPHIRWLYASRTVLRPWCGVVMQDIENDISIWRGRHTIYHACMQNLQKSKWREPMNYWTLIPSFFPPWYLLQVLYKFLWRVSALTVSIFHQRKACTTKQAPSLGICRLQYNGLTSGGGKALPRKGVLGTSAVCWHTDNSGWPHWLDEFYGGRGGNQKPRTITSLHVNLSRILWRTTSACNNMTALAYGYHSNSLKQTNVVPRNLKHRAVELPLPRQEWFPPRIIRCPSNNTILHITWALPVARPISDLASQSIFLSTGRRYSPLEAVRNYWYCPASYRPLSTLYVHAYSYSSFSDCE